MFKHKLRKRVTLNTGDFTHTKQSHKSECDINTIIKQYQKTGILNHINNATAQYLDLPSLIDYQLSQNAVIQAENAFAELPSKIRDRFSNDPAQLLAALGDPSQEKMLIEIGILKAPPAPSPAAAAPAASPPAAQPS